MSTMPTLTILSQLLPQSGVLVAPNGCWQNEVNHGWSLEEGAVLARVHRVVEETEKKKDARREARASVRASLAKAGSPISDFHQVLAAHRTDDGLDTRMLEAEDFQKISLKEVQRRGSKKDLRAKGWIK